MENKRYLTEQIITYLGNKRSLLNEIGKEIKKIQKELNYLHIFRNSYSINF